MLKDFWEYLRLLLAYLGKEEKEMETEEGYEAEEEVEETEKIRESENALYSRAICLLRDLEGVRSEAYTDVAGLWTIGVGHLLTKEELDTEVLQISGKKIPWRQGLSSEDIDALLRQDLIPLFAFVEKTVKVPLTPGQRIALVSFIFNVGRGAFKGSTLLGNLNAGGYDTVPDQLYRWVYAGGKQVKGLINRRRKEIEVWCS